MIRNVATGETHDGTCTLKLSRTITRPSAKIEYIEPFFRYLYFFTFSMLVKSIQILYIYIAD